MEQTVGGCRALGGWCSYWRRAAAGHFEGQKHGGSKKTVREVVVEGAGEEVGWSDG